MTKLFYVALVQRQAAPLDAAENLRRAVAACKEAKERGAALVLFPEMWSTGYARPADFSPEGAAAWRGHALSEGGDYLRVLRETARALEIGVAATGMFEGTPFPRNTAFLIGPDGSLLLRYAKVHTCDFDMERFLTPGDAFPVCGFPLPDGESVRLGFMICFDREFPESARLLMLGGAEIILVPNASPMDPARLGQLSARSFENMVGTAMANYPGLGAGRSAAFSPVVYSDDGSPVDNTLLLAGEEEGIFLAPFDLDAIREYRSRECWGNAFRRPETYAALLDPAIRPPFIRPKRED